MPSRKKNVSLVLFSILLLFLLNFPLLSLANRVQLVLGLPVMYVYLFGVWIGAIIVISRLADRSSKKKNE